MIGHLYGEVLFSDGNEVILTTPSGVGYQVYSGSVHAEGSMVSLFVSQVIRENSQDLYGFETLREKKLFEMLLTVKSVGAKSAFALMSFLSSNQIIEAVLSEDKAILKKTPGIGDKAASQMVLDLSKKIMKVKMYENKKRVINSLPSLRNEKANQEVMAFQVEEESLREEDDLDLQGRGAMMQEALMACRELGFKEELIIPKAQKILSDTNVTRSEQLVHLVLKEL